jgi:hypothetical protein
MKRLILLFPLIFFLGVSQGLFTSCEKITEDIVVVQGLIGMWSPNNSSVEVTANGEDLVTYLVDNFGYTEEEAEDYYDELVSDYFYNAGGSVIFNNEKNYFLKISNTEEESGTWSVSADGAYLYMTFAGQTREFSILKINANTLTVQFPDMQEDLDVEGDGDFETTVSISGERTYGKSSNGGMGG